MLSWFTRNTSKPSKPPPPEQQQPRTEVAPSPIPKEKPSSQEPTTRLTADPAPVVDAPPAATVSTLSEQPQNDVFTTALNTPHDAVLAELHGHPTGHELSSGIDATPPSTSAIVMQSIDTLPPATSDTPDSIATSTLPPPESLHDPFTGMTVGILSPTSSTKNNTSSEELWAHLSRIRSLQADVARLHLTMEGIGLGDSDTPHLRSTTPRPVGERLEDDENIDGDGGGGVAEKRREREFERSEQRFDRRKEEIGQIMSKLDEVSQALAAFHSLDTPVFKNSAVAATSHARTVSSTSTSMPLRRPPTSRPPDLHRVSLEASPRGREEFFIDTPLATHEPLPSLEEPEIRVEYVPPDASVA